MASSNVLNFPEQIKKSRKKIRDCFKRSHEALQVRENILLSRVDEIERKYISEIEKMRKLLKALDRARSQNEETLFANELNDVNRSVLEAIDNKIKELNKHADQSIEFDWDNTFETAIVQLGNVKLNGQTVVFPTIPFPPHERPAAPDYKAKRLPVVYCSKNPFFSKGPGELWNPKGLAVEMKTGNVYIADFMNDRVQVFSCNGYYLFMFSEKMNEPRSICVSQDKVFVTQWASNCINVYELEGRLLKSVGSKGNGEAQFDYLRGIDGCDRDNNIYVCEKNNNRVQILTEELKYHAMLGVDHLKRPRDVKATRDRVFVLDESEFCMSIFNTDDALINRVIIRGDGKQTSNPFCFDIDRDYNIIMSDRSNHCVCVFNEQGELIHKIGKEGQGIGEFHHPFGIALNNTGRIVVVCEKKSNCLQLF